MTNEYLAAIDKSAAYLRGIVRANLNRGYLAGRAWEEAACDSSTFGILYDVKVTRVAGALTETEAAVAERLIKRVGIEDKTTLSAAGRALIRAELAAEARRLAVLPLVQAELGAA